MFMNKDNLTIVYVPIEELVFADYNPRRATADQTDQLEKNIREFGFVDPILVNSNPDRKNIIIGGHFRVRVAKKIGMKEVPVVYIDIADIEKEKELNVRLNKNTGEWDWDLLSSHFDTSDLTSWGFTEIELGLGMEERPDDDDVPSVSESITQKGDIYEFGGHRVLCGDSTNPADLLLLMENKRADMVFTDPPYNVDYTGGTKEKLTIENDKFETAQGFFDFLYASISAMKQFVRGDVYIAMSSSEIHTLKRAFEENGGHWSTFIIWVKNTFTLGRSNYQRQYEPILYGWFEGSSHYFSGRRNLGDVIKEHVREEEDGSMWVKIEPGGVEGDIWNVKKPSKNKEHPTMKPVDLCGRAILNSSLPDNIVLDSFLGSGSTLIACEKLHRKCYGIELDPHYVDVIVSRWCKFTNNTSIKRNGETVDWGL